MEHETTWERRPVCLQARAEGDYLWICGRGGDDSGPTDREIPRRQVQTKVFVENKCYLQDISRAHEAADGQMESMSKWPLSCRALVNSVKVLAHQGSFCSYMTLEHAAVLKSYSMDITRHRARTYRGDTKHLPNHNVYTQNKLLNKHVPGTSIHFTHTLRGVLHACVPETCSRYKITTNADN